MSKSNKAAQEAIEKTKGVASNLTEAALDSTPNQKATIAAADTLSTESLKRKPKIVEPEPSLLGRIGSSIAAFGSYVSSSFSALGSYVSSFLTTKESVAKTVNTNSKEADNITQGQKQSAEAKALAARMVARSGKTNLQSPADKDIKEVHDTHVKGQSWIQRLFDFSNPALEKAGKSFAKSGDSLGKTTETVNQARENNKAQGNAFKR